MIILIDACDNIINPFLILKKIHRKLGIVQKFLSLVKGIYQKPTANIILNHERPNVLETGNKVRISTFITPIQNHTKNPSQCNKARKISLTNWKGKKLNFPYLQTLLSKQSHRIHTKKLLELICKVY